MPSIKPESITYMFLSTTAISHQLQFPTQDLFMRSMADFTPPLPCSKTDLADLTCPTDINANMQHANENTNVSLQKTPSKIKPTPIRSCPTRQLPIRKPPRVHLNPHFLQSIIIYHPLHPFLLYYQISNMHAFA